MEATDNKFREMRRKRQMLSAKESEEILRRMTNGTLALHGDGGYPYAVPVSYVYSNGRIYFHTATQGHKVDALIRNDKVCVKQPVDVHPVTATNGKNYSHSA